MSDEVNAMIHGLPVGASTSSGSFSPARSMAYGLAGHGAAAAIDAGVSMLLSGYEQRQQERLMKQQFKLQREMTKSQMSDMRESYERAGLSPTLLANGGFSPAHVDAPSPAMQNVSGKNPDTTAIAQQKVLEATLAEQNASVQNLQAQTEGQKLKNEEQDIVNDRLRDEDESSDANMREFLRETIGDLPTDNPFRQKMQERLDNPEIRFTSGSVKNNLQFTEFLRSHSSYNAEQFSNAVEEEVSKMILNSPDVLGAKASMPYAQFKQVEASIHELSALIGKYSAECKLMKTQGDLNVQATRKLGKEMALMDYELQSKKLSDGRYLFKTGNFGDLGTHILFSGAEFAGDVAKVFIGAKAFKSGAPMIPPSYGSSTAQNASKALPKVSDISRGQRYSAKELASIPLEQRRKMAQIEFNTYRYEHPRMGQASLSKIHEKIGAKYGIFKNPQNRLRK